MARTYIEAILKRDRWFRKYKKARRAFQEANARLIECERECYSKAGFKKHKTRIEIPSVNFGHYDD